MSVYEARFDGYQAMIDAAERPSSMRDRRSREYRDAAWAGTSTFPEAVELARHGWADGAAQIKREADKIADLVRPKGHRLEVAYSVVGPGVLDMGRYIMGHPEPWMAWRESETLTAETPGRGVLRILVNIGASHRESTVSIFERGAAVCALVDALETDGYRCEVSIGSYTTDRRNDNAVLMTAVIKAADQPLEMDALAFWTAHNAAQRRMNFAIREHAPGAIRQAMKITPRGTYGLSRDLPYDVQGDYDIYVGTRLGLHDDMAEWVMEQLDAQGVEVEGYRERKEAERAAQAARMAAWRAESERNPAPAPKPPTAAEKRESDRWFREYQQQQERNAAEHFGD